MPPVASQVVTMTTNGAPGDDKAVQPAIPCFQFEKEKYSNNMVEKVLVYISVMPISQSIGCEYHVNRASKTKDRQADNPNATPSSPVAPHAVKCQNAVPPATIKLWNRRRFFWWEKKQV